MNIIVLATAVRTSGALTIYRQFIYNLPRYINNDRYYVFIDPSMDQPMIDGVKYINESNHSWIHRIWMDFFGQNKWLKDNNVSPDVIVSLQNCGIKTDRKQLIYYHQPLPFYKRKWNPFKKSELLLFCYKYIYPYFVKKTLNKKTDIVVQIPYIKRGFIERFHWDEKKVHVLFPDLDDISSDNIKPIVFEDNFFHFIYPASAFKYKEHLTIVKALFLLKRKNPSIVDKIRFHLTIEISDFPILFRSIVSKGLIEQFIFEGKVNHDKLLSYYKSSTGFVFPSTIETLGLPLLEAASFGLPIITVDLDYAHEVLSEYEGAIYVKPYDYENWCNQIYFLCINENMYKPLKQNVSSWPSFFELIK